MKPPLGQSLLSLGQITADMLAEALRRQANLPSVRIGRILRELGVAEESITSALAKQAGIEWIHLAGRNIAPELSHRFPVEFARKYRMLPIEERDGGLMLAVTDPTDLSPVDMIAKLFGVKVTPVLVPDTELAIALDQVYGRVAAEPQPGPKPRLVEKTKEKRRSTAGEISDQDEAAAVRVLNSLLSRAIRDGASDIHIEPFEKALRVRLRIDGILHEVATDPVLPKALTTRCKILASLDPAESRRPQDGRFRMQIEGRSVDIRVSTIATAFGEKTVLRLLDRQRALLDLASLGMEGETVARLRTAIARAYGLILVTGPTGSGKTTTLYAALTERNDRSLNITTIEDPVEYDLFGINQIQVHPKINLTFARGLRHILRQDPDIIFVGEIRDAETAEVAVQSAMTGHLVFSTLHTNDAVGAIARLLDLGGDPFLLADSIIGVLSQRLVRKLCPQCRKAAVVTADEADLFRLRPDTKVYRAVGCSSCLGTGYRGRLGIFEMLSVTPPLSSLIRKNASSEEILAKALAEDHKTLRQDGIDKALAGLTTLDEIRRVV